MDRIVSERDGIQEEIFLADDLNFKPKPQCKHVFTRVASKKVECSKCTIGYMDNNDFPLTEVNKFYSKS